MLNLRDAIRIAWRTFILVWFLPLNQIDAQSSVRFDLHTGVLQKKDDFKNVLSTCKLWMVSGNNFVATVSAITPASLVTRNRSVKTVLPLREVLRIDFPHSTRDSSEAEILRLTNGDRLVVTVLRASQETIQAEWYRLPGWAPLTIDLTFLQAIFFSLPEPIAKRRILERRLLTDTAEDELIVLRNGDRQRGEFQSLNRSRLTLHNQKITRSRILGVRFDPRFSEISQPSSSRQVVYLKNGSKISGTIQPSSRKGSMKLKTAWGTQLVIPLISLKAIEFYNSNTVPLSTLKPLEYRFQPYLSGMWSFKKNSNVLGGSLRIRSRESSTGIGMHSSSQVTFALNRRYQSFQTWIGIDDDARGKGNAIFTIQLDGKIAFRSKPVTGKMQAIRIKPIKLNNVKQMTLVVEYGEEADIADYANWFAATLVRKNEKTKSESPKNAVHR